MASLLKEAKKPLILVGQGALISGASKEIEELAETLNIGYQYFTWQESF